MTIRAGPPDSWATQNFDYDSDMVPADTAADDTGAPQHDSAREPILDSETSDRNKRLCDNPVNNRVQLCPAAVLAAVNRGNNKQARQLIPTWLLLQSDTWARQAQTLDPARRCDTHGTLAADNQRERNAESQINDGGPKCGSACSKN